jgi:hypothetical protein
LIGFRMFLRFSQDQWKTLEFLYKNHKYFGPFILIFKAFIKSYQLGFHMKNKTIFSRIKCPFRVDDMSFRIVSVDFEANPSVRFAWYLLLTIPIFMCYFLFKIIVIWILIY